LDERVERIEELVGRRASDRLCRTLHVITVACYSLAS
jgi:hypothetical protein